MNLFFTSDTHFFHRGVLPHRPWVKDLADMHVQLIAQWNSVVPENAIVYHLGDLSFGKLEETSDLIRRLNGKIRLVPGNHDNPKLISKLSEQGVIEVLSPIHYLKEQGERIMLCHYPMLTWRSAHHGAWHLHGHCHGNLIPAYALNGKRLDVGVDTGTMKGPLPYTFEWIKDWMKWAEFEVVDHHIP